MRTKEKKSCSNKENRKSQKKGIKNWWKKEKKANNGK